MGLKYGFCYSVEPIHFKKSGRFVIFCLWYFELFQDFLQNLQPQGIKFQSDLKENRTFSIILKEFRTLFVHENQV